MVALVALWLAACSGSDDHAYIVEGTVAEVNGPNEIVVDHHAIKGLMDAMTMPFDVNDPALIRDVVPGDQILARLVIDQQGSHLEAIRVTGHVAPPPVLVDATAPLRAGEVLAAVTVPLSDGQTLTIGSGEGVGTAVGFLYTRCAMPEFCPALVTKFQALQAAIGTDGRIVAITLDPEHDTALVLGAFATTVGANPQVWHFGRLEGAALTDLAGRAGLSVDRTGETIVHGARMLVLDREGRLVERYDDNRFPADRVVEQLRTGGPAAPAGSDGTITPR